MRRILVVTAILVLALPAAPAVAASWTDVTWGTTFSQPYRNSEAQGFAIGGKLYSFSGFDAQKTCCPPTSRAYRLDPATGWTALAPMPPQNGTRFGGVTHSGFATDGSYVYWAGGNTADAAGTGQIFGTREVWRYDPAANTYLRMPDLPLVRAGGELEYLDGKLYFFSGYNLARTQEVGEHWVFDLANAAAGWVARAPLPNPRSHMGSAVLGGLIYAIGGQHGHDAGLTTQPDVHAYDPATDTWTRRADLPKAVGHISGSTFVMDGRIVVIGGETANNAVIADAYAYDPDTNGWTALTPLPSPRRSGVADVIDGVIYYTTGQSTTTFRGVPNTAPASTRRFNFQPAGAPAPAGHAVEPGFAYDAGRGYGWVREDSLDGATHAPLDVSPNARDRNLVADQRLDTFIHMQFPASAVSSTAVRTPAAWELAVADGMYDVTMSVGDAAANYDSTHRINAEGVLAIGPFVPASSTRFASATRRVSVSDGRLTIDARGGANTKLDYVEVAPAPDPGDTTPPAPPSGLAATAGDARVALSWTAGASGDVAGYRVYRGTSTPVPAANPISGSALVTGTSFTDTTAQNGTTYHYVVAAVDASANESTPSETASATPRAAAATVDLKVNFQPSTAAVPAGYTPDGGLPYNATRGFGWIREDSLSATHAGLDVSRNARDRNLVADQRLDTLIHMQYLPGGSGSGVTTPAAWEAAVPDGTYEVTVGVGDGAPYYDSTHRIRVEGVVAIAAFVPTSASRFAQATQTVTVADGRLTVDALGGTNTKLDYVTIRTAAATPGGGGMAAATSSSTVALAEPVSPYVCELGARA